MALGDPASNVAAPVAEVCRAQGGVEYVPLARRTTRSVFAHEWGHLNQQREGLTIAQAPLRWPIENELNADCQAGMFMALERMLGRPLAPDDVIGAFANFCSLGDDALGMPLAWFDPQAHGTCEQRTEAFARGYWRMLQYGSLVCSPTGFDPQGRPTGLNTIRPLCDP